MKSVCAFTCPGNDYPGFISVRGDRVFIGGAGGVFAAAGPTATLTLKTEEWEAFKALLAALV